MLRQSNVKRKMARFLINEGDGCVAVDVACCCAAAMHMHESCTNESSGFATAPPSQSRSLITITPAFQRASVCLSSNFLPVARATVLPRVYVCAATSAN